MTRLVALFARGRACERIQLKLVRKTAGARVRCAALENTIGTEVDYFKSNLHIVGEHNQHPLNIQSAVIYRLAVTPFEPLLKVMAITRPRLA